MSFFCSAAASPTTGKLNYIVQPHAEPPQEAASGCSNSVLNKCLNLRDKGLKCEECIQRLHAECTQHQPDGFCWSTWAQGSAFDAGEKFIKFEAESKVIAEHKADTQNPTLRKSTPVLQLRGPAVLSMEASIHGSYDDAGATCTDPIEGDL